ncbi:hypothetical protein C7I84_19925 [Mesorhizobium ephedrae]|uniref:HTH araC/xylS-type domain-containing protein n=2 Tax=Kumtagia ephedrae TaxID=2116701 RepID=A0A2P7S2T7_9HYPH|nr:hypothetical protein C7I84_19925 [Mesorhizobium ephedrae]
MMPDAPSAGQDCRAAGTTVHRKRATDLSDAAAYMSQRYCGHRLDVMSGSQALDFRHIAMEGGNSAFNILQYGAEVSIASSFEDFYMLELPLDGGVDIDFGSDSFRTGRGLALLLSPGPRFVSHWRGGTRQLMLQIRRELVEARIERFARRSPSSPPVFNPVIDLRSACGRHIEQVLGHLADAVTNGQPAADRELDAVVPSLIDDLLRNIAFRQAGSIVLERLHATPRQVKLVIDLFRGRYGERLSMPDVARAVGISERSLFDGFQRYYQRSPLAVLTDIRMEQARRFIREGFSAAEAARRAGVHHPGRFSSAYRRAFGVLPSEDRA